MNDKEKKLRIVSVCYFLGSAGFYVGAIMGFLSNGTMAVPYLGLGSALLCLGGATLHRINAENDKKK